MGNSENEIIEFLPLPHTPSCARTVFLGIYGRVGTVTRFPPPPPVALSWSPMVFRSDTPTKASGLSSLLPPLQTVSMLPECHETLCPVPYVHSVSQEACCLTSGGLRERKHLMFENSKDRCVWKGQCHGHAEGQMRGQGLIQPNCSGMGMLRVSGKASNVESKMSVVAWVRPSGVQMF